MTRLMTEESTRKRGKWIECYRCGGNGFAEPDIHPGHACDFDSTDPAYPDCFACNGEGGRYVGSDRDAGKGYRP